MALFMAQVVRGLAALLALSAVFVAERLFTFLFTDEIGSETHCEVYFDQY